MTAPRTWRIDLPMWQRPPLNQNQRLHWAEKARITHHMRVVGCLVAISNKLPKGLDRVHLTFHWQPAVARKRDTDNPIWKPFVDGLVTDYGLVPDDSHDHVTSEVVIHPPAKPARLWLEITERPKEDR